MMEPRPTKMPMMEIIKVMLQAQLSPFQSPYATAKYANPIIMRIPPRTKPNIGNKTNTVKPLKSDPIPPNTASIAIIVTPNGLLLCMT